MAHEISSEKIIENLKNQWFKSNQITKEEIQEHPERFIGLLNKLKLKKVYYGYKPEEVEQIKKEFFEDLPDEEKKERDEIFKNRIYEPFDPNQFYYIIDDTINCEDYEYGRFDKRYELDYNNYEKRIYK